MKVPSILSMPQKKQTYLFFCASTGCNYFADRKENVLRHAGNKHRGWKKQVTRELQTNCPQMVQKLEAKRTRRSNSMGRGRPLQMQDNSTDAEYKGVQKEGEPDALSLLASDGTDAA